MKRIIICCDGTWNSPDKKDSTNVELLFRCIPSGEKDGIKQVKYYEQGVGTSTYNWKDRLFGGLEGRGIDDRIKNTYLFLMMNYNPGDELYFFGFSRGAYTARSIAGLIRNCGILKPENLNLIDRAYELYRNRNEYATPDSDYMTAFRYNYSIDTNNTPIKFLGIWDTVGSLGIPLGILKNHNYEKNKFHDVKLSSYVENAYHALAIDEHRKAFQPALWEISKNGIEKNQKLEQRWFVGAHSNVGGGYSDTGLSDIALQWMIDKAKNTGLLVNCPSNLVHKKYKFNPLYKARLINSLTPLYRLLGPVRRVINEKQRERQVNATNEIFITNEIIDKSVEDRWHDETLFYKPVNLKKIMLTRQQQSS